MSPTTVRTRASVKPAAGTMSSSTISSIAWSRSSVSFRVPRSRSFLASRLPRNPAPPVIRTFTRTYSIYRRVMRCGQDGPYTRRTTKAICRYCRGGQRSRRPSWPQPGGTGRSGRISLSVAPNIESMRRRDPPRTASQLASVAHVPVYGIGSSYPNILAPASTWMAEPVMAPARSEQRNATAKASSSGRDWRLIGCSWRARSAL